MNKLEQMHTEVLDALHSLTVSMNQSAQRSKASVQLLGALAVGFQITTGQTDDARKPLHSQGVLLGWSIREVTGNTGATVIFRDGGQSTDDEVASLTLNAGESSREIFPHGVALSKGLYLDVTAGTIAGVVYFPQV
jgi:hypothetical protein